MLIGRNDPLECDGKPTPPMIYGWPADRAIPPGYEELEVVPPEPVRACVYCDKSDIPGWICSGCLVRLKEATSWMREVGEAELRQADAS